MAVIEALVVLQMLAGPDLTQEIRSRYAVVAAMPPRLLVVEIEARDAAALRAQEGVAAVATDPQGAGTISGLSEGERLFALGWAARGAKSGPRAGEGEAWDAPGFEPPGAPRP